MNNVIDMKKSILVNLTIFLLLTATISCNFDVDVNSVSLNMIETKMTVGGNPLVLLYTISPSNATNQSVTWRSSNENVAIVNQDGIVQAVFPGTAIITVATRDGDRKDHCTITVENEPIPVSGVTINPKQASITLGGEPLFLT